MHYYSLIFNYYILLFLLLYIIISNNFFVAASKPDLLSDLDSLNSLSTGCMDRRINNTNNTNLFLNMSSTSATTSHGGKYMLSTNINVPMIL